MLKKLSASRPDQAKDAGFTLLEVMIAMAIMLIALASILAVESSSINATHRAKQLNIVAMLAKGRMIKLESEFEGKSFSEFRKEDGGTFVEPYQDYRWTYKVKELAFPNIGG
ncbi:type II secretion system protein, partial [Bdellovibrionota bacterium FG-2]